MDHGAPAEARGRREPGPSRGTTSLREGDVSEGRLEPAGATGSVDGGGLTGLHRTPARVRAERIELSRTFVRRLLRPVRLPNSATPACEPSPTGPRGSRRCRPAGSRGPRGRSRTCSARKRPGYGRVPSHDGDPRTGGGDPAHGHGGPRSLCWRSLQFSRCYLGACHQAHIGIWA